MYSISLFLHIVGALGIFAALVIATALGFAAAQMTRRSSRAVPRTAAR